MTGSAPIADLSTGPDLATGAEPSPTGDLYAGVIGQERAVAQLQAAARNPVHAYLLVGPPGTGKRAAAQAFAAALLCPHGGDGTCESCRQALAGVHPDLVVVERQGAAISVPQAAEITRLAMRSPVQGDRKVLVLVDFHLVAEAGPALLKTIEEPPASTVFVVLAEHVPTELVTIASRCCRVDFGPLSPERVAAALEAEGVPADLATEAASSAGGRLDRARLLASDPGFALRREAWRAVPAQLDGTGATVARLVDELLAATDTVLEPLRVRHTAEREALDERVKVTGERGAGRKELEERQRREERRLRTDELRSGLATLAAAYRDRLTADSGRARAAVEALGALRDTNEALVRNPNEPLQLQALLLKLSRLHQPAV
jgi:DNA polymerase-3 subunit delta'